MPVPLPPFLQPAPPIQLRAFRVGPADGVGAVGVVEYNGPDAPSPEVETANDTKTARRRLFIRWPDRFLAELAFVGYPMKKRANNSAGVPAWYLSRSAPHLFNGGGAVVRQDFAGEAGTKTLSDRLYCSRFRTKGLLADPVPFDPNDYQFGAGGAVVTPPDPALQRYVYGDVEATYSRPPYFVLADDDPAIIAASGPLSGLADEALLGRYVSRLPRPAGKVVTTPRNYLTAISDVAQAGGVAGQRKGTPINEGFPIFRPSLELFLTWHQVPYSCVPFAYINQTLGCVNDAVFDPSFHAFPKGTALLAAVDMHKVDLPTGDIGFDVTYRVLYSGNYDLGLESNPFPFAFADGTAMPVGQLDANGVAQPAPRGWNAVLQPVNVGNTTYLDYLYVASCKVDEVWSVTSIGNPPFPFRSFDGLFRPPPGAG